MKLIKFDFILSDPRIENAGLVSDNHLGCVWCVNLLEKNKAAKGLDNKMGNCWAYKMNYWAERIHIHSEQRVS